MNIDSSSSSRGTGILHNMKTGQANSLGSSSYQSFHHYMYQNTKATCLLEAYVTHFQNNNSSKQNVCVVVQYLGAIHKVANLKKP